MMQIAADVLEERSFEEPMKGSYDHGKTVALHHKK
jgi:hypothetical protein